MYNIGRRDFLRTAGTAGVAGIAGCLEDIAGSGGGSDKLKKFGMTSYVRGGAWITAYNEAAKFYAKDQNIQIEVRPNQQSAQKQVKDIRDFANKGFDGILVGVWQTGAAKTAIDYAMKQNVPVFATNADTASTKIPMYTGFSN